MDKHTVDKKWPEMVVQQSFMREIRFETEFRYKNQYQMWHSLTPQTDAQTYHVMSFFILVETLVENSNLVGQEQVSK